MVTASKEDEKKTEKAQRREKTEIGAQEGMDVQAKGQSGKTTVKGKKKGNKGKKDIIKKLSKNKTEKKIKKCIHGVSINSNAHKIKSHKMGIKTLEYKLQHYLQSNSLLDQHYFMCDSCMTKGNVTCSVWWQIV